MDYTERGSSPIDWCENNYLWTSHIAEFYNTISNGVFFLIPPISIYLFRDYARHVTYGIHAILFMLIVVGAGSVYFHATLTMAGQLMDELSILWVIMTGISVLFPEQHLPVYFHKNKNQWYGIFVTVTVLITYLCFLRPYLNAYFLMLFALPVLAMLSVMVRRCRAKKVQRLARRTGIISATTITLWIADRVLCDVWIAFNIPYLHSIFHILVFVSSYYLIVIFAYFTADYRVPHLKPSISYWPSNKRKDEWLGLPYVALRKLYQKEAASNGLSSRFESDDDGDAFQESPCKYA